MKWLKRLLILLLFLITSLGTWVYRYLSNDTDLPYLQLPPYTVEVPTFTEVPVDFQHNFNAKVHLPVMGSAIIDINGDDIPEVWVGGGENQADALFQYNNEDSTFTNIAETIGLANKPNDQQSYGPTAFDIDQDGDQDLLVAREDDVYLYTNNAGKFTMQKLNIPLDEKSTPLGLTYGDINGDGLGDLFVSAYLHTHQMEGQTIFNQEGYGANSLLLANRGNGKFEDITKSSGLAYIHNTFLGVFIDVDDDKKLDLVVAHDTGETRTYKNLGEEKFEVMPNPMTGKFGYPMGIAVGDYNNDAHPDFFFSNVGSTMPSFLLRGDLTTEQTLVTKWLMYENKCDFQFEDVAAKTKLADYEFAWGAIFEDFNLDGLQDLVVAENYVDLPNFKLVKLPCRFLLNTPKGEFIATGQESGVANENFAISPLSADFNNDGYPDLVYANIDGPLRIWLNDGGDHNFLKVKLEQTALSAGAKVTVTKDTGEEITDWMVTGEGLGSDQSHTLIFGLGDSKAVKKVKVTFTNGKTEIIKEPEINKILEIASAVVQSEG